MEREEIFTRLNNVFRDVFDIEDWDSLEHINLIVAIEQEFGLKFNMHDVTTFKNVGEMVNVISNYLNK